MDFQWGDRKLNSSTKDVCGVHTSNVYWVQTPTGKIHLYVFLLNSNRIKCKVNGDQQQISISSFTHFSTEKKFQKSNHKNKKSVSTEIAIEGHTVNIYRKICLISAFTMTCLLCPHLFNAHNVDMPE